MDIKGWAFASNAEELSERNLNRYKELKDKGVSIYHDSVQPGYAHTNYQGVVIEDAGVDLSVMDIGLLCDNGNLCFGGSGSYDNQSGRFRFKVHTD